MKERKRLTEEQINKIALEVTKKTLNKIKKTIAKEMEIELGNFKGEINIVDMINVVMISMTSLDVNMLMALCDLHKHESKRGIDFDHLIETYIGNLSGLLIKEKQKLDNERMN